jgi:sensor histidine kinase YesM
VDKNLNRDEILLPPMLIQPFIENAIWYGPSNGNTPMNLDILFLIKKDQLLCVIEDNGIGFEASQKNKNENMPQHTPMGIGNVRQRIRILNEKYKLNCTFAIEDKQRVNPSGESGTKVTIGLPLNFNDI